MPVWSLVLCLLPAPFDYLEYILWAVAVALGASAAKTLKLVSLGRLAAIVAASASTPSLS